MKIYIKKMLIITFTVILTSFLLTACTFGKADMEGIIIDISEERILLSKNLSLDEYKTIKDVPPAQLLKEDVEGNGPTLALIYLAYKDVNKFKKGDHVEVWITGEIMESYPEQAIARKIKLLKVID